MRIREAAERSGVPAPTIRYYEQLGLLGLVKRTAAGYRVFDERDVRLLDFLRRARGLGFSLGECSELIDLLVAPDSQSAAKVSRTRQLATHRLEEIEQQMEDLARRRDLIRLHIQSLDELAEECPVSGDL